MSYIHYCCTRVRGPNPTVGSSGMVGLTAATIASSGTSQQSVAISLAGRESDAKTVIWHITNGGELDGSGVEIGVPVYIVFGTDPTAVANGAAMRALLRVGDHFVVHAEVDAEKFAVINADVTT